MKKVHYHHCPACYEHVPCYMNCTIEPDLEDNGKEFGAHCVCTDCYKPSIDTKYSKEWWNRYHGFIK